MLAEAPALPSPEIGDTGWSEPAPEMSAHDAVEIARLEHEFNSNPETGSSINFTDLISFLNPEQAEIADDTLLFKMPEQAMSLIDEKIPAGARQNAAIISVVYEVEGLAPQFLGYIMGSGRTWWFTTFQEAMEIDPEYVAGFARGYVLEKLWQYSTF